jgi:hypothetical protein
MAGARVKKGEHFDPIFPPPQLPRSIDVLQPNMQTTLIGTPRPVALTESDIAALKSGDAVIYIFGKLSYDDVFGRTHHTTFGVYIGRDLKTVNTCQTYNEAD